MYEGVVVVDHCAEFPRHADELVCRVVVQSRKVFLRVNDGVEISAIRNVDLQSAQRRTLDFEITCCEE